MSEHSPKNTPELSSPPDTQAARAGGRPQDALFEDGGGSESWRILISLMSAYALFGTFFSLAAPRGDELLKYLRYGDGVACAFFALDFLLSLFRAKSKWKYLLYGWVDLISAMPGVPILRLLRIFYIMRALKFMKRRDASDRFAKFFARMGIKGAFLTVFALLFVSIAVSGALELHFERGVPRANILDAEDALWWAVSTVSTVGYGDTYPVTTGGRIVGMCLMFIGISLFGMCSALTASIVLKGAGKASFYEISDSRQSPKGAETSGAEETSGRNGAPPNPEG